jgi:LPXTG-motif cell wall-anchored protein
MFGSIFSGSVLSGTGALGLNGFGECPAGSHDVGVVFEDCVPDLQSGATPLLTEAPTYKPPTSGGGGGGAPAPKPAPKPVAAPAPAPSSGFSMASVAGNPLVWAGVLLVAGGGAIWYARKKKMAGRV